MLKQVIGHGHYQQMSRNIATIVEVIESGSGKITTIFSVPCGKDALASLRDDHWSVNFGACQKWLADCTDGNAVLNLDFSRLDWIDPLPAMSLLVACADRCFDAKIVLNLGEAFSEDTRRGPLLGFLSQHGFIDSFIRFHRWECNYGGRSYEAETSDDAERLTRVLSHTRPHAIYADAFCLPMRPLNVQRVHLMKDSDLEEIVRPLLGEIRRNALIPFFQSEPEQVDSTLYKLRILISEIVLNAYEHAYRSVPGEAKSYALFARLRNPSNARLRALSARIREEEFSPTLKDFSRAPDQVWVELFYYDAGRGMVSDATEWLAPGRDTPLFSEPPTFDKVSRGLFSESFSRNRRDGRTTFTGLQHIGLVLARSGDFARGVVNGEWVGAMHPWPKDKTVGVVNLRKRNVNRGCVPAVGTGWHFCLLVDQQKVEPPAQSVKLGRDGVDIDPRELGRAISAYGKPFDDRGLGRSITFTDWANLSAQRRGVWLPGVVTKQSVHQWLKYISRLRDVQRTKWIIGDIDRRELRSLVAILLGERWNTGEFARIDLQIFLLSNECDAVHVRCVDGQFVSTPPYGSAILRRFAQAYAVIKHHDSKLFWRDIVSGEMPSDGLTSGCFLPEKVLWARATDTQPEVVLNGYLDLTQALVDPVRAGVARRALARVYHLVAPNRICHASDQLLAGLMPSEARGRQPDNDPTRFVVVNSVRVTGETARLHEHDGFETIFLLQHEHIEPRTLLPNAKFRANVALDWLIEYVPLKWPDAERLKHERIPGGPYVGRGGAKAIPIRRFYESEAKDGDFSKSFYGQNPAEMYDHFDRLGLLRLGHWHYGGQHHLMTLNLSHLVQQEGRDVGPFFQWFKGQIEQLVRDDDVKLVVYVAHEVTNKLVEWAKANILPNNLPTFIAVQLISKSSQTALRIPSITYDRIRNIVRRDTLGRTQTERTTVAFLDDGSVTGRTAREMEQLLTNAGAAQVAHIGIVTRTGLPLYRKTLAREGKSGLRRYYWRWDVPPLGEGSSCALCRVVGLAQALLNGESTHKLQPQKTQTAASPLLMDELRNWIEHWGVVTVGLWRRAGSPPLPLPAQRPIKFGKEWRAGEDKPHPYFVSHSTSTGLAAMVAEIVRTTSYKGAALGVIDKPWPSGGTSIQESSWRLSRLEIIVTQLLLFSDDLSPSEMAELSKRYFKYLLSTPLSEEGAAPSAVEALACLLSLMVSQKHVLPQHVLSNIRACLAEQQPSTASLFALGVWLRSVYTSSTLCVDALLGTGLNEQQKAKVRARSVFAYQSAPNKDIPALRYAACRLIYQLGDSPGSTHVGFVRKILTDPVGMQQGGDFLELHRSLAVIYECLATYERIGVHCAGFGQGYSFADDCTKTKELVTALRKIVDGELENCTSEAKDGVIATARAFLTQNDDSLCQRFQRQNVQSVGDLAALIPRLINGELWRNVVESKAVKGTWCASDGTVSRLPNISLANALTAKEKSLLVFAPPEAIQVLTDYAANVFHRTEPYVDASQNDPDMIVQVTVLDKSAVVQFRNRCVPDAAERRAKHSEQVFQQQVMGSQPMSSVSDAGRIAGEYVVTICLPLSTALA